MDDPLEAMTLAQLRDRTSLKWRAYPPDVLPLWVAEMDVPLAAPVAAALTDAITRSDTGYAHGTAYAAALATFARDRWGWDIEVARTALVPDVMRGAVALVRLVTRPGDAVVINPPVYPPFTGFLEAADREVVAAPLGADGRLDLGAVEAAFAHATAGGRSAAYLLCSPHNPTGVVHTADELTAVAELADAAGVRVVVDEIHAPLVLAGSRFVPYLSLGAAQRGFAVHSASKGWNLAGLKAAVAVAGTAAADDLARLPEVVEHGASHLGVIAHTAALTSGGPWLDALLTALADRRELLGQLLATHLPDAVHRPPAATYLAWLDLRTLGLGDDPAAVLLERGRVAVMSGLPFGPGGAGHVRLNLATSRAVLTAAVQQMGAAVATHHRSAATG